MSDPRETARALIEKFLDEHGFQIIGFNVRAGQDPRDAMSELIAAVAEALGCSGGARAPGGSGMDAPRELKLHGTTKSPVVTDDPNDCRATGPLGNCRHGYPFHDCAMIVARLREALTATERQRDEVRALREQEVRACMSLLYVMHDALGDLPDKPFDAEATLRAALAARPEGAG